MCPIITRLCIQQVAREATVATLLALRLNSNTVKPMKLLSTAGRQEYEMITNTATYVPSNSLTR